MNFSVKYRPDIDGLRALAVLSVVLFHAFPELVAGGFIGVDVFFVISGFLISGIILGEIKNNNFNFISFYGKRIRRIFPALILILLVVYIAGWFLLLPDEFQAIGKHITGGGLFISNFVLWHESGYFDKAAVTKPLMHLWSLGIEEQFYIIWPFLLWGTYKLRFNQLLVASTIVIISFCLDIAYIHTNHVATFYLPLTRFWELAAGGVLANIQFNETKLARKFTSAQSILGALFIFIGIFTITKETAFPGWWTLLPVMGALLIISAGSEAWFNKVILSNKITIWFGIISYPLYLWHWPLLSYANIIETGTPTNKIRLALIATSIFLAWLTYIIIEKRIRFGSRLVLKTFMLCTLMTIISCVGYYTYVMHGLSYRFAFAKEIDLSKLDITKEWRFHDCYLQYDLNDKIFPDNDACVEKGKKPLIFLWGDSSAATVYGGLKALQAYHSFSIAQFTANSCPPIIGFNNSERPLCPEINNNNLNVIRKIKPDIVLLNAAWYTKKYPLERLEDTISELRKIGIKRIIILGSIPFWNAPLTRVIANNFYKYHWNFPQYMNDGLSSQSKISDDTMLALSNKLGVEYISAYQAMCNTDGCLTKTGNGTGSLAYIDGGHLTPTSSIWLLNIIKDKIFNNGKLR